MRGALCVATRLYILYLAADESISGWEFLLLIPKSPQFTHSWGERKDGFILFQEKVLYDTIEVNNVKVRDIFKFVLSKVTNKYPPLHQHLMKYQ